MSKAPATAAAARSTDTIVSADTGSPALSNINASKFSKPGATKPQCDAGGKNKTAATKSAGAAGTYKPQKQSDQMEEELKKLGYI
ncbi:hypothetical protein HDU89_003189 [Geranomyces variabilis]|nr:hypothetical protein HDU89_003189 [Geranomyces variabilis]